MYKRRGYSNTCLLAVKDRKGKIILAGDRRNSWGMHLAQRTPKPKVSKRNGVLFAGTGVSYLCELIGNIMPVPPMGEDTTAYEYMHTVFYDALIKFLRDKNILLENELRLDFKTNPVDPHDDISAIVLIAVSGELFELYVGTDGLFLDNLSTPFAHGCGGMYALGAYDAQNTATSEVARLRKAIEIAARHSPGCDAEMDYVKED